MTGATVLSEGPWEGKRRTLTPPPPGRSHPRRLASCPPVFRHRLIFLYNFSPM